MRILLIEDDVDLADLVKEGLTAAGFEVNHAARGEQGLRLLEDEHYDIVVLDFYMPGDNGDVVAKVISKKYKGIPVVMLSVDPKTDRKVEMLEFCDDYMTKPFDVDELIARIKSVTRRVKNEYADILEIGDLRLDTKSYEVMREGKGIKLRNKEFALLEYMMKNAGVVLSRGKILENVWNVYADPFTNTVDVHIRFLRSKIDDGFKRRMILTVPKRGYKLLAR